MLGFEMGHCIIQLGEYYLVWSSIVDAPITYGLTEYGLRCWLEQEWGREGLHY